MSIWFIFIMGVWKYGGNLQNWPCRNIPYDKKNPTQHIELHSVHMSCNSTYRSAFQGVGFSVKLIGHLCVAVLLSKIEIQRNSNSLLLKKLVCIRFNKHVFCSFILNEIWLHWKHNARHNKIVCNSSFILVKTKYTSHIFCRSAWTFGLT